MTLANDSFRVTDRVGGLVTEATHVVALKDHEVQVTTTLTGHQFGSNTTYTLGVDGASVTGTNGVDVFDIWNGTDDQDLVIAGLWTIPRGDTTAFTGTTSFAFEMYRTSTIGTGGSDITRGESNTAFDQMTRRSALDLKVDPRVTARRLPAGGAAASAFLGRYVARLHYLEMGMVSAFHRVPGRSGRMRGAQAFLVVNPGEGFKLRQANRPSTGNNFSHLMKFNLR